MINALWLLSIPFVFLMGFMLASCFALADIKRLAAELKQKERL